MIRIEAKYDTEKHFMRCGRCGHNKLTYIYSEPDPENAGYRMHIAVCENCSAENIMARS